MVVIGEPEEGGPHERSLLEIERTRCDFHGETARLGQSIGIGEPPQIHDREGPFAGGLDHLNGTSRPHRKGGPERLMPAHNLRETSLEGSGIERAAEPEEPAAPPPDDDVAGATAMLHIARPARKRAPPREEPEPPPEPEPEQPTVQRRGRERPALQDNGRTQILDIRNAPSPEEVRQHLAREKLKSAAAPESPASGWTATRVFAILAALALIFGLVAAALAFLK